MTTQLVSTFLFFSTFLIASTRATNFASLVSNDETPSNYKSILTIVCSSTSLVCLFASGIVAFKYNRFEHEPFGHYLTIQKKRFRFVLHMNLIVWLGVVHLLVLVGMDRVDCQIDVLCPSISVLLLFSILTTFTFKLLNAIHLHNQLVSTSCRLNSTLTQRFYLIAGYSIPLVIIIASFFVSNGIFETREYFCWISSSRYPHQIWILLGPLSLIILINFCIYIRILYLVLRWRNKSICPQTGKTILWTVTLFFNLGIPWALFAVQFSDNYTFTIAVSYIFILVNGLQGISILGEQCLLFLCNKQNKRQVQQQRQTVAKSVNQNGLHSCNNHQTTISISYIYSNKY